MRHPARDLYIGLMSGTSLDGIDAVLASFAEGPKLLGTLFVPFPPAPRDELLALLRPTHDELHRSARAGNVLAGIYADAVNKLLRGAGVDPKRIRAIGCHGQTVRHNPQRGYSIQLVNAAALVEQTGISVVCDFRSRDIAAGGQGAPLVPGFHAAAFRDAARRRAIVNLGGIANITFLPGVADVTGFDSGPGNVLMDEWVAEKRGLSYDADGGWAAQGQVQDDLLKRLLADPYFSTDPPKSTGREAFNIEWARAHIEQHHRAEDVQATFAELTARSVAAALTRYCGGTEQVFLCGGGAANAELVRRIRRALPELEVASTAALGIEPDWVEALAFAWLARETISGRPANLPSVTGARGARILGCIYPA